MKRTRRCIAGLLIISLLLSIATINKSDAAAEDNDNISISFENGTLTISGTGTVNCPKDISNSEWKMYRENTKKLVIMDGITEIGEYAFEYFVALEEIVWPDGMRLIQEGAFQGCTSLKKFIVPDDTQLLAAALRDCTALEEVEFGSFKSEGRTDYNTGEWFVGDINLKKFTVSEDNEWWFVRDNVLYRSPYPTSPVELAAYPAADEEKRKEFHIPDYVKTVRKSAFDKAKYLEKLTMSASVTELNNRCFTNMIRLKQIEFSESLTEIPHACCRGSKKLEKVVFPKAEKFGIDLCAFSETNIDTLVLPANAVYLELCTDISFLLFSFEKIVVYNPKMRICGKPKFDYPMTFCANKNSTVQKYVDKYKQDYNIKYNIQFEELYPYPIEVSEEILDRFDVTVDDMAVTEADKEYEGTKVKMIQKPGSNVAAVGINHDEVVYLQDGVIEYDVKKAVKLDKTYIRKEITNAEELMEISKEDTSHTIYSLKNDIDMEDMDVVLENRYILGDFEGVLEGNNCTITIDNLVFAGTQEYAGLWKSNRGIVRNCKIYYPGMTSSWYIVGICSENHELIQGCTITGKLSSKYGCYGICDENRGTIENSTVDCQMRGLSTCAGIAWKNLGYLYNDIVKGSLCANTNNGDAAGICGNVYNYGCAEKCINYAEIKGEEAAGLVRGNWGDIIDCKNYGTLEGTNEEGDVLDGHDPIISPSETPTPSPAPTVTPTVTPTPKATEVPTAAPTVTPTPKATTAPTAAPTVTPTPKATTVPTAAPTVTPTPKATTVPTAAPTVTPTPKATTVPTAAPTVTLTPTPKATTVPTAAPTVTPTPKATTVPTAAPTVTPTPKATTVPTAAPTITPTPKATTVPTAAPTVTPTPTPTVTPTPTPTSSPVPSETPQPTASPMPNPSPLPTSTASTATPVSTATPTQNQGKAVASVKVKKTKNNQVRLNWENVADTYQIWRSKGSNQKYQLLTQISRHTSYVDTKVQGGKTYYYKIVAIAEDGSVGNLETAKEVKVTMDWLRKPVIKVKNGKKGNNRYIEIKVLRYSGKYAQIQVKKSKKYRKISIGKKSISSYKGKYRLRYTKRGMTLWLRVRTWKKMDGKKRYSAYSKPVKIKTA